MGAAFLMWRKEHSNRLASEKGTFEIMRMILVALLLTSLPAAPCSALHRSGEAGISKVDEAGIDAAITGVYQAISGPAGKPRDFEKLRSLFARGASVRVVGSKGLGGGSVEDYIARSGPLLLRDGFTERELGRRTQLWGDLATVWSSYDGRTDNGSYHERGINSFELVKINDHWLIASILWQNETPDYPLPRDLSTSPPH